MKNLILVRHGQSFWNKKKRFTGWADIDLTEKGKSEAENAGKLIKKLNIKFHSYFTSRLKRAVNSLSIISNVLNDPNVKISKAWQLNERHYGALTSLNKDEVKKKHGIKQVQIWRRSFDIPPPPMEKQHPYKNNIFSDVPADKIPESESLKDTYERVIPYYKKNIEPLILSNQNILIVFHGNSCRALLKKIFDISEKKITEFEIPTGNPLLVTFEKDLKVKNYKYLDSSRAKKILFNI